MTALSGSGVFGPELMIRLAERTGNKSDKSSFCVLCEDGYTVPLPERARLEEWELVEKNLHCSCELGQKQRKMDIDKWNDYVRWVRGTKELQEANRSKLFKRIGVPRRFLDMTLSGFISLADGDPGKQTAIEIAESLSLNQFVVDRGVQKNSVYLFGPRGCGKTGLLSPVFMGMARSGLDCLFAHYLTFMRMIRQGYQDGDANAKIDRAIDVDVLFIDDLGQSGRGESETDHSRMVIQDIIYYRHAEERATFITSNLTPAHMQNQFAEETWQRVDEMSVTCAMNGKTLRTLSDTKDVSF